MDNKKIILIGVIILIIAAAVAFIILTTVNYERIDITPNGTSIDVPANQTKHFADIQGLDVWKWNDGILVTYNNHDDQNNIKLSGMSFKAMKDLIENGYMEKIDNFTCYTINADDLLEIHIFDVIKVNYNGKFYCIPLSNESTYDNLIICCKDKNMALHIAKSVVYKKVYSNDDTLDHAISTAENMTGDLKSKAEDYVNNVNLTEVKSTIENKAGDLMSNVSI